MGEALRRKGFSKDVIEQVLRELEEKGFIGDESFAREWAQSRVPARFLGRKRLKQELTEKGIAPQIIGRIEEEVYREYSEEELAFHAARKRLRTLRGLDPIKRQRRLATYLERRGFPFEAIKKVIEEVGLKEKESEQDLIY